jgi:hypothetical protein
MRPAHRPHGRGRARTAPERSAAAAPRQALLPLVRRARHAAAPVAVARSASATEIKNRSGSRSSPCTGTQAARPARPDSAIQERSRTVFPLPAGADNTVTRPAPVSLANSAGREMTPRGAAATISGPAANPQASWLPPGMLITNTAARLKTPGPAPRPSADDTGCAMTAHPRRGHAWCANPSSPKGAR